jgi:predicted ABC-type exoprotein transport system permease subunit
MSRRAVATSFLAAQALCAAVAFPLYHLSEAAAMAGSAALALVWIGLLTWFVRLPTQDRAGGVLA